MQDLNDTVEWGTLSERASWPANETTLLQWLWQSMARRDQPASEAEVGRLAAMQSRVTEQLEQSSEGAALLTLTAEEFLRRAPVPAAGTVQPILAPSSITEELERCSRAEALQDGRAKQLNSGGKAEFLLIDTAGGRLTQGSQPAELVLPLSAAAAGVGDVQAALQSSQSPDTACSRELGQLAQQDPALAESSVSELSSASMPPKGVQRSSLLSSDSAISTSIENHSRSSATLDGGPCSGDGIAHRPLDEPCNEAAAARRVPNHAKQAPTRGGRSPRHSALFSGGNILEFDHGGGERRAMQGVTASSHVSEWVASSHEVGSRRL